MYNVTDNIGSRYIAGDKDPEDFSWNSVLTNEELLVLLQRNGKIRKATAWVAREAVRPRFVLKKEKKMLGTKHKQSFTFDTTIEYLEWIGFFTELEKVYTWSRLFGASIIVLFKEGEVPVDNYFLPITGYDSCRAYYPLTSGNGYQIQKDGDKYVYVITFTDKMKQMQTWKVHPDRIVTFNAPHLELKFDGSSNVEPMAKLAILQEQLYKSVMQRLHLMAAGVVVINVANDSERSTIQTSVGKSFKYLNKIYTTGDPKVVMEMFVPELKSDQFRTFWDITQEEIATDMNMSKKLVVGDSQGAISSAKYDTEISYTEVYQTQRHYKRPTEEVLFFLGIGDTTFQWNDPFPTEALDSDNDERKREGKTDSDSSRPSEDSDSPSESSESRASESK